MLDPPSGNAEHAALKWIDAAARPLNPGGAARERAARTTPRTLDPAAPADLDRSLRAGRPPPPRPVFRGLAARPAPEAAPEP